MNKTLFLQLNKHNIYLIEDQNISFYISIPKTEFFSSTNISLDLKENFDKIDTSKNDSIYVKDELSQIYDENIDNENITLIIPLFKNNILTLIQEESSEKYYEYLDKCISYIINNAYKILVEFGIKVNTKIIFVRNEKFDNFINWFTSKYKSRIDTKQYSELIAEFTSVIPVLSKEDISNFNNTNNNNSETEININKSSGFISYVLLGTICIVLTLLILYKLL